MPSAYRVCYPAVQQLLGGDFRRPLKTGDPNDRPEDELRKGQINPARIEDAPPLRYRHPLARGERVSVRAARLLTSSQ